MCSLKYFRKVVVFIVCLISGCQSTIFSPPVLNVSSSSIDIPHSSNLQIQCWGKHPVLWKFPQYQSQNISFRLNITSYQDSTKFDSPYGSELTVENLLYTDTGFYSCYYDGTTNFKAKGNITSVYVFVNDPEHLILPDPRMGLYYFLTIYQSRRAQIRCLPTNSKVNMTFWKIEGNDDTMIPVGKDIHFDPMQGFIIHYPWLYYTGHFECKASLNEEVQSMKVNLFFLVETTHIQQPYINTSQAEYVLVNNSFTLTCTIAVEIGTAVFMEWDYPNKHNHRIIETASTSVNKNLYSEISTQLIVSNVSQSDEGNYYCNVTDHSEKKNFYSTYIAVYEKQQSYVNFSTHFDTTIPFEEVVNKSAKFVITYLAIPSTTDLELVWLKDNTSQIMTNSHYEIRTISNQCILRITKLRRTDSGTYTLIARTPEVTANISLTLLVKDEPLVSISSLEDKCYMLQKRYKILCSVDGYPLPIVEWMFKPLGSSNWTKLTKNKTSQNEEIITQAFQNQFNIIVKSIEVTALHSGHYACIASNEIGSDNRTIPFIVSDAKNGFEIVSFNQKPVELDSISLICKVNTYNFTDVSWVFIPSVNGSSVHPLENSSDTTVTLIKSTYSLTLDIQFHAIHINDSGIYQCTAWHHDNSSIQHTGIVTISVRGIVKPHFNATNLNGSIINVEHIHQKLDLYCYAEGIPPPIVTWFKNEELLDVTNISGMEFTDNNQRLKIQRLVEDDTGLYQCMAENKGGVISLNTTLSIKRERVEALYREGAPPLQGYITIGSVVVVFIVIVVIISSILAKKINKDKKAKREMALFNQTLFNQGQIEILNPDMPLDHQAELLPYDNRWEFPKERLKLGKTLGQGAFGRVVKAEAIGLKDAEVSTTVAVKMLKERADTNQQRALMAELKILIHLGRHLNIVNILGSVTKNINKGELLVIVEYCHYGNLQHYLLRYRHNFVNQVDPNTRKLNYSICTLPHSPHKSSSSDLTQDYFSMSPSAIDNPTYRDKIMSYANVFRQERRDTCNTMSSGTTSTGSGYGYDVDVSYATTGSENRRSSSKSDRDCIVTTCDLLCYSFQCARGMEYLASRKLIHRDLAARNVLLAKNNIVKICDFGLAKDCYKYDNYVKKGDGPLPIKWMAIESIRDRVFTTQSDVWSFGILLWEFFTLGGNPYPGLDIDEEFYRKLKHGYRNEKPDFAPDNVFQVMLDCWNAEPEKRPCFSTLAELLGELLEGGVRQYYIDLNDPYLIMNKQFLNNNDYLQMDCSQKSEYINVHDVNSKANYSNVREMADTSSQYDQIQSVRAVGDGPVPKEPMEVVPMIQLDSMSDKDEDLTVKPPQPDAFPTFKCPNNTDYLNMGNFSEIDHEEEGNDSVFLDSPSGVLFNCPQYPLKSRENKPLQVSEL